jgi:outer membrane immunogenic protein
MRASIIAAIMLVVGAGIAVAADMPAPVKAPPQQFARVYDWTGFYIGANVGGGWAKTNSDFSIGALTSFASVDESLIGAIAGGQVGYNWQSGAAVFGLEADFQWSGLKGGISAPCPPVFCAGLAAAYDQKVAWFGTVRGRLGYASDGWLIYATGGYAYSRFEIDAFATAAGIASAAVNRGETRNGWTAGAGIEVMLARNWTARIEYLYLDFGEKGGSVPLTGLPPLLDSTRLQMSVVRAALNYKF